MQIFNINYNNYNNNKATTLVKSINHFYTVWLICNNITRSTIFNKCFCLDWRYNSLSIVRGIKFVIILS